MVGQLNENEIDEFLATQLVGRIGCHADGETYIVPISYAYDQNCVYCHTLEGKKSRMMRKNPKVCFEVYDVKDMVNWKSVLLQGEYEELHHKAERDHALRMLLQRNLPVVSSATTHLGNEWPFGPDDPGEIDGIVFRIVAKKKSGRFEYHEESPAIPG